MTMQNAMQDWSSRMARANLNNEEVLGSMPDNPERGSYWWWARLARENTGQSLCDSGGIYGYSYEAPVPIQEVDPITVSFWGGEPDGATIHVIHWLMNTLDAADETAEAIDELLYWVATWLYPTESHNTYIRAFLKEYEEMKNWLMEYPNIVRFEAQKYGKKIVRDQLDKMSIYDLKSWQREMDDDDYVQTAMREFPVKALKHLADCGLDKSEWGGQYTYNNENDMSQDFAFDTLVDDYGDTYVILQTHNGCDARGGMSTPVVAKAFDICYFFDWTVDAYCFECHEQWETMYHYTKDLAGWKPEPDAKKIEAMRKVLIEMDAMEAGQGVLPGFNDPRLDIDADIARLLIADYDEQMEAEEEEYSPPYAIIEIGNNAFAAPDFDGSSQYPAGATRMICPKCGKFSVVVSNIGAYGI